MILVYIENIRNSLKNECYFSALSLALTLPDICGNVEYPGEEVGKRYINWVDKYLKECFNMNLFPEQEVLISGEMLYNLRNCFLHLGNPSIDANKIKNPSNRIDRFCLLLGDGSVLRQMGMNFGIGEQSYREMILDVSYLCEMICIVAEWYYKGHQESFEFNYKAIKQKDYFNKESTSYETGLKRISYELYKDVREFTQDYINSHGFKNIEIIEEELKAKVEKYELIETEEGIKGFTKN